MNKYTVIALSVSGKGSKIHSLNDVVTDMDFAPGVAADLVKKGFLKQTEFAETEKPAAPKPAAPKTEAPKKKPAAPKKK